MRYHIIPSKCQQILDAGGGVENGNFSTHYLLGL